MLRIYVCICIWKQVTKIYPVNIFIMPLRHVGLVRKTAKKHMEKRNDTDSIVHTRRIFKIAHVDINCYRFSGVKKIFTLLSLNFFHCRSSSQAYIYQIISRQLIKLYHNGTTHQ